MLDTAIMEHMDSNQDMNMVDNGDDQKLRRRKRRVETRIISQERELAEEQEAAEEVRGSKPCRRYLHIESMWFKKPLPAGNGEQMLGVVYDRNRRTWYPLVTTKERCDLECGCDASWPYQPDYDRPLSLRDLRAYGFRPYDIQLALHFNRMCG